MTNRGRESERDIRAGDDNSRLVVNQPSVSRRASDEKAKGPRRDAESNVRNRNSNEVLTNAARAQSVVAPNRAASEEKPPETRTTGGRKFRRQGNAWVDSRFKSSMTVKSISRGSNDFDALDSGLRSIAQQLGQSLPDSVTIRHSRECKKPPLGRAGKHSEPLLMRASDNSL